MLGETWTCIDKFWWQQYVSVCHILGHTQTGRHPYKDMTTRRMLVFSLKKKEEVRVSGRDDLITKLSKIKQKNTTYCLLYITCIAVPIPNVLIKQLFTDNYVCFFIFFK